MAKAAPAPDTPEVWILDTSALLEGDWTPQIGPAVVPPGVAGEFAPGGRNWGKWQRLLAAGVEVRHPGDAALNRVHAQARGLGETKLSPVDLEVAALAQEAATQGRRGVVVTEDYALQNLLAHLGLEWQGVHQKGITTKRTYRLRCAGCGRWFPPDGGHQEGGECPVCGSVLRRRRIRE